MRGTTTTLLHTLGEIILVVALVVAAFVAFIGPAAGFDVKKYFGLQPILGQPGEVGALDLIYQGIGDVNTKCKKFTSWQWSESEVPIGDCKDVVSGLKMCTFESTPCPLNTYAVSCATRTKYGNGDSNSAISYGDDGIISIYIPEGQNFCRVEAVGTDPQARKVGVLCAALASGDVQYKWGSVESTTTSSLLTIGTTLSCDSGFTAISGMVETDNPTFGEDMDDRIVNISIYSATLKDYNSKGPFKKKFGKVCLKDSIYDECGIKEYQAPETIKKDWYSVGPQNGGTIYNRITYQMCPGDSQLISCGGGFVDNVDIESGITSLDANPFDDFKNPVENGDTAIHSCQIAYHQTGVDSKIWNSVLCAENIWHWSQWYASTNSYPTMSITCPAGSKAVACASDTASLESGYNTDGTCAFPANPGGGFYGEDAISSIYFNGDTGCIVKPWDRVGGVEHKRRVGVLCIDQTTYNNNFEYVTKNFDLSTGATDYYLIDSNFANNPTCPADKVPVFCTIHMDESDTKYEEDMFSEVDIDTSHRNCNWMLLDRSGGVEFKGTLGVLCANKSSVVIKNDWANTPWIPPESSIDFQSPFFKSEKCSAGIATTALTITDRDHDEYKQDFLISMMPNSEENSFVIQASDTEGDPCWGNSGNEHRRKVGTACLNYPEDAFIQSCTGTPKPCSSFNTRLIGCDKIQKGCTDGSAVGQPCTGTPTPCDERTIVQCLGATGCTWS